MGIRRLAIEAKTFDKVVEKEGSPFFHFLGLEGYKWLCNLLHALREGTWKDSNVRRCKENYKLFFAEVGNNSRGEFLIILECI